MNSGILLNSAIGQQIYDVIVKAGAPILMGLVAAACLYFIILSLLGYMKEKDTHLKHEHLKKIFEILAIGVGLPAVFAVFVYGIVPPLINYQW